MNVPTPTAVELTPEESALWAKIPKSGAPGPDESAEVMATAESLARSLLGRGAIPEPRRRYFLDPALNIGGSGSRAEVFERNGTRGEAILRHPHFLPYLRYFILGPDLPAPTIAEFLRIVEEDAGTSGEVMDQLRRYARAEIRRQRLNPKRTAEEFHKLAIEVGLGDGLARAIRDAAMQAR